MITYDDAEKALNYLKSTDIEFARRKCLYEGLDDQKKTVDAIAFISASGSAAERSQEAKASSEYQDHIQAINEARIEFETMRNQRQTAALQIEMWKSINYAMKMGNV